MNDNSGNNSSLIRLFDEFGMVAETALSTEEALAILRAYSYDILLTDMHRADDPGPAPPRSRNSPRLDDEIPVIVHSILSHTEKRANPRPFAATSSTDEVVHSDCFLRCVETKP